MKVTKVMLTMTKGSERSRLAISLNMAGDDCS
jgi:hypothetical protein